jgi:hypothetical protein
MTMDIVVVYRNYVDSCPSVVIDLIILHLHTSSS